ncbi:MAG: rod shape-determining protein MreD [Sediminibacterium sp.]|nr:rod shape-determining protein MreD [Sediminibacterium sp.]
MHPIIKHSIRFIFFILLQVFVLNTIPPLHQFIVPYLYFLFILWLPVSISRISLLLVAFLFGLTLDYFTGTLGLHAAPCVAIAFLRPFLLKLLLAQETAEASYMEPGHNSMGWAPFITYAVLLTIIHHSYLVLIEWLQFGNFLYFMGKVLGTSAISLLLILIAELLIPRREKQRAA